jgi:hypothetical protein
MNDMHWWSHLHLNSILEFPNAFIDKKKLLEDEYHLKVIKSGSRELKSYTNIFFNNVQKIDSVNNSREEFVSFIEKTVNNGYVSILSPLSENTLISSFSLCSHLVNFIAFYEKASNEVFYFVQNHELFAGYYFPSRNLFIQASGGSPQSYVKVLKELLFERLNGKSIDTSQIEKKEVKFLSSCTRPYHFFYNFATAISVLGKYGLTDNFKCHYIKGGDFYDLSLLDNNIEYLETSRILMREDKDSFYLLLGMAHAAADFGDQNSLRQTILTNSSESESEGTLKIWFGVTSQKRSWVEQKEGAIALINYLHNRNIKFEIIFDGWTAPIHSSKADIIESKKDMHVVEEIISLISFQFKYSTVIGCSAKEKIDVALSCDYYIANHASGSLFVSRFAGLQGLSHLNNVMRKDNQIHHKNVQVREEYIKDLHENGKVGQFVSYSLNADDFMIEFQRMMNYKL